MSDVINVTVVEEETEKVNETKNNTTAKDKLKRFAKKIFDKGCEAAKYMYEHPVETGAMVTSAVVGYNKIVKPTINALEDARHDRTYFDRYGSQHSYECRRKLKNNELYELDMYVRNGGNAYEWLKENHLAK